MEVSIIIAASAVVWPAATYMFGRRHGGWYARDEIRKLKNGIACRDRKLSEADRLEKNLRGWLDQRDLSIEDLRAEVGGFRADLRAKATAASALREQVCDLKKQLEAAGKPDQPRDPITGRWLSKEAA